MSNPARYRVVEKWGEDPPSSPVEKIPVQPDCVPRTTLWGWIKRAARAVARWVTWACLGSIALGILWDLWPFTLGHPANNHFSGVSIGWGLAVLVGFWCVACLFIWLVGLHQLGNEVHRPIPTLQQIDQQLRLEGYTPSISDCIAVEQRLRTERNEKALVYGGLLVGGQIAGRVANGKPPIQGMS